MKKYDTIIFDLDGTLLNTLEDLKDSVNFALKKNGFPLRTIDEVRSFVGNGIKVLMELSVPKNLDNCTLEKCLVDFRHHYEKNMKNKTKPYEGIIDLLEQLTNYKLAIVSNKIDDAVKDLNQIYFEKYIKTAIGESKAISKKPAPDAVFKALEELNSSPKRAVYVGDSEVDVQTAKNSGLSCIGVTWGFRNRDILESHGADYIIDTPRELLKILE